MTKEQINTSRGINMTDQNYSKLEQAIALTCNNLGVILRNTNKQPQPRQTTLSKILSLQKKGAINTVRY